MEKAILEYGDINKLMAKFSFPAIAAMLVNASFNLAGGIFVGRGVGALALSGVTVNFPLTTLITSFGMLSSRGAAALISIRLGEGKKEEAEEILGNSLVVGALFALFVSVFGLIFIDRIMFAFGAKGGTFYFAREYARVILYGAVFQIVAFSMNSIIRSEGSPLIALSTYVVGFVVFLAITPVMIFVLGYGIYGAAIGMLIAQFMMALWGIIYFCGKKSFLKLKIHNLIPRMNIFCKIIIQGLSPFFIQVASSILIAVVNNLVFIYGGVTGLTAMGIAFSIYNFILMPVGGLTHGIQPIIGFNYGAKRFDRVNKTLKNSIIFSTVFCTLSFVTVMIFGENILNAFVKSNVSVVKVGTHGLKLFLLAFPLVGIQYMGTAYFQSIGKPGQAILLSLLRQVLLFLPLVFILPLVFKLNGIWLAGPISDSLSAAIAVLLLFIEIRKGTIEKENVF